MEWLTIIKDAIEYMEQNLLTVTGPEEVAKHVHISTIYLQRGFQVLTGYTLGEYIRNRRLFEAGLKLTQTDEKVIDIALEYGYEASQRHSHAFTARRRSRCAATAPKCSFFSRFMSASRFREAVK